MGGQPGEPVRLFDDCTGEWLGRMADVGRKRAKVQGAERLSEREIVPDLWLCAAPIKQRRVDWGQETACAMGVRRLVHVLTGSQVVERTTSEGLRDLEGGAGEHGERKTDN